MKRLVAAVLAVLGIFAFAAPVLAQQYPGRTVTIILPYAAYIEALYSPSVVRATLAQPLRREEQLMFSGKGTT